MKDCNKFDTGMAEPKLENLWSNPFVFSSTIKYLKYKKNKIGVSTHTLAICRYDHPINRYNQDFLDLKRWPDKRLNRTRLTPHTLTIRMRLI